MSDVLLKGSKANVLEAIGNTPIVKLNKVIQGPNYNLQTEIYVKLEYLNPGGSIKDRIGTYILQKAIKEGKLKAGGTIIEATSGNTGVGVALFACVHGYKCIFVLADKQSQEKINNLKAFGAEVVVCPTNVEPEDPRSYYSVAKKLAATTENSYYMSQYDNLWNREAHFMTTGPEIFQQTQGEFDAFLATVGTGGTISGIAQYIKSQKPSIKVIGVDCKGSIIAEYAKTGKIGHAHSYVLEGIGEDFIPENYDFSVIDDFVVIEDEESFLMTRRLLREEGIYAGGSSGAVICGAIKYAKANPQTKRILAILPDSGNRYTSKIYNDAWMKEKGYFKP